MYHIFHHTFIHSPLGGFHTVRPRIFNNAIVLLIKQSFSWLTRVSWVPFQNSFCPQAINILCCGSWQLPFHMSYLFHYLWLYVFHKWSLLFFHCIAHSILLDVTCILCTNMQLTVCVPTSLFGVHSRQILPAC